MHPLQNLVQLQKKGVKVGIYSACTANDYALEAVLEKARDTNSVCLIESTSNQVNQFGGYTNMTPADFYQHVMELADKVGIDPNQIILGGDHLGPLTWTNENESEAMEKARTLVYDCVLAGYTKIHIDTSMKLNDDDPNTRLSDETIARRGAYLANAAQQAYAKRLETHPNALAPVYIVGSEVPIPGGAQSEDAGMQITRPEDLANTIATFKNEFKKAGLADVWNQVIAVVVQPGVEEADLGPTEYDRSKAVDLMAAINDYPTLVFEGHSTDYQTKYKLRELVEDGVGVLKVGPGLTFPVREALFALSFMEDELYKYNPEEKSNFRQVLDEAMLANPKNWQKHYHGSDAQQSFKRAYSFSDRCRYYLPSEAVEAAVNKLVDNMNKVDIPLSLLSQFMPIQYTKVRNHELALEANALIKDRVKDTIDEYMFASHQEELTK